MIYGQELCAAGEHATWEKLGNVSETYAMDRQESLSLKLQIPDTKLNSLDQLYNCESINKFQLLMKHNNTYHASI